MFQFRQEGTSERKEVSAPCSLHLHLQDHVISLTMEFIGCISVPFRNFHGELLQPFQDREQRGMQYIRKIPSGKGAEIVCHEGKIQERLGESAVEVEDNAPNSSVSVDLIRLRHGEGGSFFPCRSTSS